MQQDVLLHFWVIFFKMRWKYENCKLLTSSTALYLSKLDEKTVRGYRAEISRKMQHKGSVLRQGHKKCTNLPPIFHRLPTTQYVYVEKFHFLWLNRKA